MAVSVKKVIDIDGDDSHKKKYETQEPAVVQNISAEATSRVGDWLTIAFLMVVGAVLSLSVLINQSLRLDESQSLWQTSRNPIKMFALIAQDVHVPLYHLMLHYWEVIWGNSVFVARFPSLLFFLLSIPMIYILGRYVFSRTVGLFASILFAISPFMNWYGNEIRMYSLMTVVAMANQYFFMRILKRENRYTWIPYAIFSIVGMYVHYFFAFVLLTQAIFFLMRQTLFPKGSFKKFFSVAVLVVIALAPWLIFVYSLGFASNTRPLIPVPTSVNLFNAISEYMFGFHGDQMNTIIVSFWPLAILFAFLSLQARKRISPEVVYIFLSAAVPILAAFVLSFIVRPMFLSRYLIIAVPPIYLFLGWAISNYPPKIASFTRWLLILSMLGGLGVEIVSAQTPVKEDYKQVADYLDVNTAPQDVVVMSAPFTIYPLEYYYSGPSIIETLPLWDRFSPGGIPPFSIAKLPAEVDSLRADHARAWVVLSYDQGYEKDIHMYFETHFRRLSQRDFSPGLHLYEYQLRY